MPTKPQLRGGAASACSLIKPVCKDFVSVTPKNSLPEKVASGAGSARVAARAAPVAFAADDFAEFVWPSYGGIVSGGDEEAKVLNDLLQLGLELGDLENVFGNTDCAVGGDVDEHTSNNSIRGSSDGERTTGGGGEGEGHTASGEVGLACYTADIDGDATEEFVVLDSDLEGVSGRDLHATPVDDLQQYPEL